MGCPVTLPADTPRFATRSTARKRNSGSGHESLVDHIRGVYNPADGLGECEERDDVFPIPPPALGDRRVFPAPFALFKAVERVPGGCLVGGTVDALSARATSLRSFQEAVLLWALLASGQITVRNVDV